MRRDARFTASVWTVMLAGSCAMTCRRAMESAVKWMYSVDKALTLPWDDKLVSLLSCEEFRAVAIDS